MALPDADNIGIFKASGGGGGGGEGGPQAKYYRHSVVGQEKQVWVSGLGVEGSGSLFLYKVKDV